MKENQNQLEVNTTFKEEINTSRSDGDIFTPKKSATVALATIGKLKLPDGSYISLTGDQTAVLNELFYPTNEGRMRAIKTILKASGVDLDDTTKAQLRSLLNPSGVEKKLKDMANPEKKTLRDFLS